MWSESSGWVERGLCVCVLFFFFQAEDGIRGVVRSRGLGDVYKRTILLCLNFSFCLLAER